MADHRVTNPLGVDTSSVIFEGLDNVNFTRDMDLALVDGIDLILAGHDHNYEIHENNNVKIVKSGTDFNDLSEVTLHFDISLEEAIVTEENGKAMGLSTIEG